MKFMKLIERLKLTTDHWWVKRILKPLYLPSLRRLKYLYNNTVFRKQGESVLQKAHMVLNDLGVMHWLEFGTLLGVVREGKLIDHDTDIDFGIFIEDYSENISNALVKAGFKRTHRIELNQGKYGLEESFEYRGVSLDLFYFTKTNEGMYCHLFPLKNGSRIARELHTSVNGFKSIQWRGLKLNIPEDEDARLKDTYGDYWVKRKNWYTPDQALNSKLIDYEPKEIIYE